MCIRDRFYLLTTSLVSSFFGFLETFSASDKTLPSFEKRRRHNSRRKNGHRQEYSMIRINKIFSKDGKVLSEAEKVSKKPKKEGTKEAVSK